MARYQWKDGARIRIPAQAAGERIETLTEQLGRGVTAQDIVADAVKLASPLHAAFVWDNDKAAEQHRIQQAGHLLRCLVVVRIKVQHPKENTPRVFNRVRALHPVTDSNGDRGFQSTVRILGKEELRAQLLASALDDLDNIRRRYKQLTELAGVFAAVDEFRKQVRAASRKPTTGTRAKAARAAHA